MKPRAAHEIPGLSTASLPVAGSSAVLEQGALWSSSYRTLVSLSRLRRLTLAVWLLSVALAPSAAATPEYPLVIDAALDVSCARPNSRCLICHTSSRGGQGTAVQPFARTLYGYGLVRGRDSQGLQSALLRLSEETDDSDEDGLFDEDELRLCGNPSGEELGVGPEYGCDGAHLARDVNSDLPFVLVAVAVAGLLLLRARSEGPPARRRDPPHR